MGFGVPLQRHCIFATSRLDEARDGVARFFWPHRIDFTNARRDLDAAFHHAPIAAISLNFVRYGADTDIDAGQQPDCFMFKYTQNGGLGSIRGRDRHDLRPHELIVSGPQRRLRVRFASDTGLLVLKVPRARLEGHLSALLGDRPGGKLCFHEQPLQSTGSVARYIRLLHFLASELEENDALVQNRLAAVEYEEFLLSTLLHALPHNALARLERSAVGMPAHVGRVMDYIEANADLPLTAARLVAVSGTGASALYGAFRRHCGLSPLGYLRALRLGRVRAELKRAEPGCSVTSTALKWGFTHLGRFSSHYRSAYGETPSQTLAHARRFAG